jgi:peptide-methionine (S)-S-oxide reductase
VLRTRVGYCGGTTPHPTYHDIGDHTESVEIDYDPRKLSYAKLVEFYASGPSIGGAAWARQYRNAIFYHGETQHRLAVAATAGKQVDVEPYAQFTLAEDYHQKYSLQNSRLAGEFAGVDLVNSTAAARVNGYLDGYGDKEAFSANLDRLGLTSDGQQLLTKLAGKPGPHCQ